MLWWCLWVTHCRTLPCRSCQTTVSGEGPLCCCLLASILWHVFDLSFHYVTQYVAVVDLACWPITKACHIPRMQLCNAGLFMAGFSAICICVALCCNVVYIELAKTTAVQCASSFVCLPALLYATCVRVDLRCCIGHGRQSPASHEPAPHVHVCWQYPSCARSACSVPARSH